MSILISLEDFSFIHANKNVFSLIFLYIAYSLHTNKYGFNAGLLGKKAAAKKSGENSLEVNKIFKAFILFILMIYVV